MLFEELVVSVQRRLVGRFALANSFCDLECPGGVSLERGVNIAEDLREAVQSRVNQTLLSIFGRAEILCDCPEKLVLGEFGLEESMNIPENSGKLGGTSE